MVPPPPEDESMLKMFGGLLGDLVSGPPPIPDPEVERAIPPLSETQQALVEGMAPQEAIQYAMEEGRKYYTFQQISGFMREQAKAEQMLEQADASIPLLRAAVSTHQNADGVEDRLVQEALTS